MNRIGMLLLSLGGLFAGVGQETALGSGLSAWQRHVNMASPCFLGPTAHEAKTSELIRLERIVLTMGGEPYHAGILLHAGEEFGIDPILLSCVAYVESNFRCRARSKRGARGIMQLRPVVMEVLGVTDPWDPYQNIMAGAAYLLHCFERYKDQPNSTGLALAAYNMGPGPVRKLVASDSARRFVRKVLRVYNRLTDISLPTEGWVLKAPADRNSRVRRLATQ
jgi:hypothetical protein